MLNRIKLLILTLVLLGIAVDTAKGFSANRAGQSLQYIAHVHSVLFQGESINATVKFKVDPVDVTGIRLTDSWYSLSILTFTQTVKSHEGGGISYPQEVLQHSVYFSTSTGGVQRLYYDKQDPEELVHAKKYLVSALSGHLQDDTEDSWEYVLEERDHAGTAHHYYKAKRTAEGREYHRKKQVQLDVPHIHDKEFTVDHDGMITSVHAHEIMALFDEHSFETDTSDSDGQGMKVETKTYIRLLNQWTSNEINQISWTDLKNLVNDTVEINLDMEASRYTFQEAIDAIETGLKCSHRHSQGSIKRSKCVMDIRKVLMGLSSGDVWKVGQHFLNKKCPTVLDTSHCQQDRNLLIDVIARIDTPEAQKFVLRIMKENITSEVERCLFHLSASPEPIEEVVNYVADLCFGKQFKHHGVLHLRGNHKRACLTLGSMLRHHLKVDSEKSEELVQKLHGWLDTDSHREANFNSKILRSPRNVKENTERQRFVHAKTVLLHVLGNAAHPRSRDVIITYAQPNIKHADLRHTAMKALRHFTCQESATTLLNATVNEEDVNVKRTARDVYMQHPKAGKLSHTDENLLLSKDHKITHRLRKGRSSVCNLIDELTKDFRVDFPGFDWSKKVGNDFIGASFGVKMENMAHIQSSPVNSFFELNIHNRAWMSSWVTLFRKSTFDIMNAEVCFKRDFRMYNLSATVDYNVMEILQGYEDFDVAYDEITGPLIQSLNSYSHLLDVWKDKFGNVNLGFGRNDFANRLHENRDDILDKLDELKETGIEWINDTFGGLEEFVDELQEVKGGVINRIEEINDTVQVQVETFLENMQVSYDEALYAVEGHLNDYLKAHEGMEFSLEYLDECMATVDMVELLQQPEEAGEKIIECLTQMVRSSSTNDTGLMGQINKLVRTVRNMQQKFINISNKVEKVRHIISGISERTWTIAVTKLLDRIKGFVDEMATGLLNFVNNIADDMGMSLQYITKAMDETNRFMENAVRVMKDSPKGAISHVTRAVQKMHISKALFDRMQEQFTLQGTDLQGKVASWMEAGAEHTNLLRGMEDVMKLLEKSNNFEFKLRANNNFRGSIRDKLMKTIEEISASSTLTPQLKTLMEDFKHVRYMADDYKDSFSKVGSGMQQAGKNFEAIKRSAQSAKQLIQKVFGIKFHLSFPKQMKTNCDDVCGGCGIYPNIMRGRKGVQLLAEPGIAIVSPFDARVVPIDGSMDEVMVYPLEADMNDYEIIITFIKPVPEVFEYPEGLFADAGEVIGEAVTSPCQPNFIHTAVRKLNSTVQNSSDEQQEYTDQACGTADQGEYIPADKFVNKPDPNPQYLEGCSKVEFKHIYSYFDVVELPEDVEETEVGYHKVPKNVSTDLIDEQRERKVEYPDVDRTAVINIIPQIKGSVEEFNYNLKRIVNKPSKNIEYTVDESGIRERRISFGLPIQVPRITDYFNTMNFTVKGFGEFLLNADLTEHHKELNQFVRNVGGVLDSNMCMTLNKEKPAKLRWENLKEGGSLNVAKDVIKLQIERLKLRGCQSVISGLGKGEQHICEVNPDTGCNVLHCITKNMFDDRIIELPVGIAFDPCTGTVSLRILDEDVVFIYKEGYPITTRAITVTQVSHINITAQIAIRFNKLRNTVEVDVSLHACHKELPLCFGHSPIFRNLTFNLSSQEDDDAEMCVDKDSYFFPCGNDTAQTFDSESITATLDLINTWKIEDFLYVMDRLNISRYELNNMLDNARVAVNKQLTSTGPVVTDIEVLTIEIEPIFDFSTSFPFKPQPINAPFFKIRVRAALFVISLSAGGEINIGFTINLREYGSNCLMIPSLSVGGYAEAEGKMTIGVIAAGLAMKGTLLEVVFSLEADTEWPKYPLILRRTLRVDLVPLGIEFAATFKLLFIPIRFTIFKWEAELIKGTPEIEESLVHDSSPPQYEWEHHMCLVEQVLGRHWSDPAFYLEAPFSDPESPLYIKYAIGSYRDGTNVLTWSDMEGVSMIVPIQLKVTGLPLHFTVKATNTDNQQSVVHCVLDTYDITPATGRFEAAHIYTSHPSKLSGTLLVIEDSPLVEEQYTGVGVGRGYYGDQSVYWYLFDLDKDPINEEGEGELASFASPRQGRLTSQPIRSLTARFDHECAKACLDQGDGCASFDFDYGSDTCDLHWTIEGKAAELVLSGAYHNFEKLGAGYTAYVCYDDMDLIHGEAYYLNARITNVRGYESYLTSPEIIVDFTCPEPGPIGDAKVDEMRHDSCSAAVTQGERCIEVTPHDNHRFIIDGPEASTVFNGNFPRVDLKYTISNHYLTANWDGFHDDETDIWGYTWAAGTSECDQDIQEWDDPHSHLADKSYWTHQGMATELQLSDGPYYVSVQALNTVVFGGALVTTVCHSTPIIVDTTASVLHLVEDIFYDEDFDLLAVYYRASDPESGIMRTDIGLGETKHDVFVRAYSQHNPLHDGYEMVSIDGVDLPVGTAVWVRIRVVNNVEMLTAGHANQPLMMDPTPPVAGSVLDGDLPQVNLDYQPENHRMCVQWYDWFDAESGIERFLWGIGTSENETDVMEFVEYSHFERSACTDISLNHSATYYNIIKAYNQAINSRASQKASDGVLVDITEPVVGWIHDGKDPTEDIEFSSQAASVYSNWGDFYDPESGIEEYIVTLSVNGEGREEFVMSGEVEYLEDHTQHLQHSDFVQFTVKAQNGAILKTESQSSGYVIDQTPPDVIYLKDHPQGLRYQLSDSELFAHWQFEDPESHIKEYRFRILEHKNKKAYQVWPEEIKYQIYIPEDDKHTEIEENIDGLELENGIRYSVEVTAVNKATLASKQESLGVTVDTTPPIITKIFIGNYGADEALNGDGEVIHDNHLGIQASWVGYDHESGIIKFMLAVGIYEGDTSVTGGYRDFGTEADGYIDGILLNVTAETGELYYVSIYAVNGAGVHSEVITSKPIHVYGENTPGIVYDGRELYADKDYTTDTITVGISFQGFDSPACGIRGYEWALGSQPGYSDVLPYTSYGIVMLNDSHAITEVHLPLYHGDVVYASVRAHTGHRCSEDILHSCSDGILVDTKPPEVVFLTLGEFGNDTDIDIILQGSLFQTEYDSIALAWNTTDDAAGALNDTWMAGSLPLEEDKQPATLTTDRQIPIRAVTMAAGETIVFSVIATDLAGNVREAVAPPLTVDVTEPVIQGFKCTEYLSPVQTDVSCEWTHTLDHESPLVEQRFAIGERQLEDQIMAFETVPYGQYSWKRSLDSVFDKLESKTRAFITLQVVNDVGLVASAIARLSIDTTAPNLGQTFITTPVTPGESVEVKVCQQSVTTMEVRWEMFEDKESGIQSYEVGVGTGPGKADIAAFKNVGPGNSVFLDRLPLLPGTQVFASVRAVNQARLVSGSVSTSVYISPAPTIEVWDGLDKNKDIDYQNDLSTLSGQVHIDQGCPITSAYWWAFDLLGDEIVNQTQFYQDRFSNDELELYNFRTYYTVVEAVDAINRTLKAKSNGVLAYTQPPTPGEVRDGPYPDEDRNYQESTEELSVNWDPFGSDDDPLQVITHYQVALGDHPSYAETRTNVHYFVDVGLSLNYTFVSLRLTPKRVEYFATVRGYSESGAHVDSVSNGIKVGYGAGMEAGDVHLSRYSNNSNLLSFYWDRYVSDFKIIHYRWGIGNVAFAENNVTLPCSDLLPLVENWAKVQPLVDEKQDRFGEKKDLSLEHAKDYHLVVVAEDEASQCISSVSQMFTVDLTPPDKGIIHIDGIGSHVEYTTSRNTLRVRWEGYKDEESGISDFYLQLFNESDCLGSDPETWAPVSDSLDVKNTDHHTYMAQDFQPDVPYRILITVINQAGSVTVDWSTAVFLDTTTPEKGVVKDGQDWTQTKYYQSSTTDLEAVFAVSPLGSTLDCPLTRFLVPVDESNRELWYVMDEMSLEDTEGGFHEDIYLEYHERNVITQDDGSLEIVLHFNISTFHLEGGSMMTETLTMLEGDYMFKLQISAGEHAVFSVTMSDGFMDEYVDFDPPIVEDQPTDEEFFKEAKSGDLGYDRDLDVTLASTESPPKFTTVEPLPTTEETQNITEPDHNYRDSFETSALGVHFLGFPAGNKTKVWTLLFWARDTEGIKSNWIYLTFDPTQQIATYNFEVERDYSTIDIRWNVYFSVNGERLSEMKGINLPHNYTTKVRYWSHDQTIPEFVDPFNPYFTSSVMKDFSIPVPRERPCQFGKAFYDLDSSIHQIYVGVGNTSYTDNIVPYYLAYTLCHSCNLPCDHYKCTDQCQPELDDGYLILTAHLTNLTLDPGEFETEEEILSRMGLEHQGSEFSDYEQDYNDTAYMSNRYHILIKAVNEAGLERLSVSPGIQIDVTPPVLVDIEATDPEYDPLVPTEYQWSNSSLAGWWDFEDKESPIFEYKVAVGTAPNASNIIELFSVGGQTSIAIDNLEGVIQVGEKYFITVEAINAAGLSSFASTAGVTVFIVPPDVSNGTSEPLFCEAWPDVGGVRNKEQEEGQSVFVTEYQDKIGLAFKGILEENVYKLEWGTGLTSEDTYISSRVEVDRRLYDWSALEIREDGYFWFGGQKSDTHLTWLAQKAAQINMTLDSEYIDPGTLWLEPGRCVYHHLYAQNMAHLRAIIKVFPVCVKRSEDYAVQTLSDFTLEYTSNQTKVVLSGKGQSGALLSTVADHALYEAEYGTSANITFRPYIVNPVDTMTETTRVMAGRLLEYTDIAILVSPLPHSTLIDPLQITLSYTGVEYEPANQSLAILYWDTDSLQWFNIEESSQKPSEIIPLAQTITGWFAGPVREPTPTGIHQKRAISSPLQSSVLHLTEPHMFALYMVTKMPQNHPPVLLDKVLTTDRNTDISTQLRYYDQENDQVEFFLLTEPTHGVVNLTSEGWLMYDPKEYYIGWDELMVVLDEVNLPVGIEGHTVEQRVKIQVRETPVAPVLFLELEEGLITDGSPWRLFTDSVTVQFEANTTHKSIGSLFVCDLNTEDSLDLLWQNGNKENVTVVTSDVTSSYQNGHPGPMSTCAQTNLKIFKIGIETSLDYHGDDVVTFIGRAKNELTFTMYSQPMEVFVYSLYSPCGTYGVCTSEHDPLCQDNIRSQSFDSYSCTCDNWHNGAWCDILNVLQVTLIAVGSCWLIILVVVGLVKFRDNYQSDNKVYPVETEDIGLDSLGEESEEDETTSENENSVETTLEEDQTSCTDEAASIQTEKNINTESRYQGMLRKQAKDKWIVMEERITGSETTGIVVKGDSTPSVAQTKKSGGKKKRKRSKIHPQ